MKSQEALNGSCRTMSVQQDPVGRRVGLGTFLRGEFIDHISERVNRHSVGHELSAS